VRPGEARALDAPDYHDGWITVDEAVKGKSASSPIGGTKTGKPKRLPVGEELAEWIERNVPRARLRGAPLFVNPRTRSRHAHKTLGEIWARAVRDAGLPHVPLYRDIKHSFAIDAIRRGVPEHLLRRFLGHASIISTRRYARLRDTALVEATAPNDTLATSWRQGSESKTETFRRC
jgi:integrase